MPVSSSPALRKALAVALLGAPVWACSIGETNTEYLTIPARKQSLETRCDSPFVAPALASLPACGGGKGHCYDPTKSTFLEVEPCPSGGSCMPDKLLTAKGGKFKSCTFYIKDAPGACLSLLNLDVKKNAPSLKQDVCDEDERCIPCVNPTNGESTHVCDPVGVHERACSSSAAADDAESCCGGLGICIREDGVPKGSEGKLEGLGCPEKQVCAPTSLVDGDPVHCTAMGLSGVCLGQCFAQQLAGARTVLRGDCGPAQVCLPCVIGASQDVPGC